MKSQYTNYFLKEYIQKFKLSMNNIYIRMQEENPCISNCNKNIEEDNEALMTEINFVRMTIKFHN